MAKDNVQNYKINLDVSNLIASYKNAIDQMEKAGTKKSIVQGLESDLNKLSKKFEEATDLGQAGLKGKKEIDKYERTVEGLYQQLNLLSRAMSRAIINSVNLSSGKINELKKQLDALNKSQNMLFDAPAAQAKQLGLTSISSKIGNEIKSQQLLNNELEKELKLREDNLSIAVSESTVAKQRILTDASSKGARLITGNQARSVSDLQASGYEGIISRATRTQLISNANAIISEGIANENSLQDIQSRIEDTFREAEIPVQNFFTNIQNVWDRIGVLIDETHNKLREQETKSSSLITNLTLRRDQLGTINNGDVDFSPQAQQLLQSTGEAEQKLQAIEQSRISIMAQLKQETEKARTSQVELENDIQGLGDATDHSAASFLQESRAIKESAIETENAAKKFDNFSRRMLDLLSVTSVFASIRSVVKTTYQDLQKLDASFASIAMVTNKTVEGMWSSYSNYAEMAQKLGQETDSMIKASALFYQQGLDESEALALTADTMKLATLAGNDYETATQEMTAAIRGFKMEMEDGAHVTDVYSTLAASAAATVDDIAQAMSRTASIANSAGMSFENTSAFLTQMIETTQESAENIGTSLKTIIARFTELKDNVAGTSQSEFDDLEYNKVDKALKSVGVSLKDASGQFRDLDDVFIELSSKWDTLDRNTQRYVATIAAGSRQQSRFIAMMDNYERTAELIETAADSTGKADEQFAKYSDTMEYKLNQLNTKWEEFRINIMGADFTGGILNSVNNLLDRLKDIDLEQTITIAPFAIWMAKDFFKKFSDEFKKDLKGLGELKDAAKKKISTIIPDKFPIEITINNEKQIEKQIKKIKKLIADIQKEIGGIGTESSRELLSESETIEEALEKLASKYQDHFKGKRNKKNKQRKIDEKEIQEQFDYTGVVFEKTSGAIQFTDEFKIHLEEQKEALDENNEKISEYENEINNLKNSITETKKPLVDGKKMFNVFSNAIQGAGLAISAYATGAVEGSEALKIWGTQMLITNGQMITNSIVTAATSATRKAAVDTETASWIALFLAEMKAALATTALAAGIGLALTGLVFFISHILEEKEALEKANDATYQLQIATEKLNDTKVKASEDKESLKNLQKEKDSIEKIADEYTKLSKKQIKTPKEIEEQNELYQQIKDEYPELIKYEDEEKGILELYNIEESEKLKNLQEEIDLKKQSVALDNAAVLAAKALANDYQAAANIEKATGIKIKVGTDQLVDLKQRISGDKSIFLSDDGSQHIPGKGERSISSEYYEEIQEFTKKITEGTVSFATASYETKQAILDTYNYVLTGQGQAASEFKEAAQEMRDSVVEAAEFFNHFEDYYPVAKNYLADMEKYANKDELVLAAMAISKANQMAGYADYAEIKAEANNAALEPEEMGSRIAEVLDLNLDDEANEYIDSLNKAMDDMTSMAFGAQDDWDDLYSTTKETLKSLGVANEEAYKNTFVSKDIEYSNIADWFGEKLYTYLVDKKFKEDTGYELTSELETAINQFHDGVEQLSATVELEKERELERLIDDNEDWNEEGKQNLKSIVGLDSKLHADQLKNIEEIYGISGDEITQATVTLLQDSYAQAIQDIPYEPYAQEYISSLVNAIQESGVDQKDWAAFLQIDWSSVSDPVSYDEFRKQQIELMREQGIANAEEMFDSMAQAAADYGVLDIHVDTTVELDEFIDKLDEIQDKAQSLGDSSIKSLSDTFEKGEVSFSSFSTALSKMKDLGLNAYDYYDIDKEGKITTNQEKLRQLYIDQLGIKQQQLLNEKAELEEKIRQSEAQLKTNQETINTLNSTAKLIDYNFALNKVMTANLQVAKAFALLNAKIAGEQDTSDIELIGTLDFTGLTDEDVKRYRSDAEKATNDANEILKNQQQEWKETLEEINEELKNSELYNNAALRDYDQRVQEEFDKAEANKEKAAKSTDKQTDSLKKLADAQEDVIEKQKKLNEALEEYNDLLYGDDNRKSSLDVLYNYDEALSSFNDEIGRSKDLLEDSKSTNEAIQSLERYSNATHDLITEETAKQEVLKTGLKNYAEMIENGSVSYVNNETQETISANFSDYVKKDERTNKYIIDQRLLSEAKFADKWKDYLEQQVSDYNKYSDQLLKSEDNVRKAEKEIQDLRKDALQKYTAMESEIAEALKNAYEQEVDDLKDKYDAMKDADDDYLDALQDAIDTQRRLRDQENAYEDLAQKEKRLSLMQRDTSGANAVDVKNLEGEIEKDRQSLLDDAIDNIIDGLSKLYESQEDLREEEIELKEALIDNTAFWNQRAQELATSFTSAEEYAQFLSGLSEEYAEMTLAQQQLKLQEYADTYTQASEYMAMQAMDSASVSGDFIVDAITTTSNEVNNVIADTAEAFTSEVIRAYNETNDAFLEDLKKAEEEIANARKALQDAIDKVNEYAQAANAASTISNSSLEDASPASEKPITTNTTISNNLYSYLEKEYGVNHNALDAIHHIDDAHNHTMMAELVRRTGEKTVNVEMLKKAAKQGDLSVYKFVEEVLGINHNAIDAMIKGKTGDEAIEAMLPTIKAKYAYEQGGLVDFTGPAWVDGKPNAPEAFLSAADTMRIGNAAKILANIPLLNSPDITERITNNSVGDTNIEINLDIDHISSDIDIEDMVERVKDEIVNATRPIGTNIFLQQQI